MTFHVMIDLETLGTSPSAAIVQLGAVKFDFAEYPSQVEGLSGPSMFERTISIQSNLDVDRTVDGSTIEWWLKQSEVARLSIIENPISLQSAIDQFSTWLKGPVLAWSHGAGFDVVILEDAYRSCGRPTPWDHRAGRDTRTMFWLAETIAGWRKPSRDTAHTALADAIAQVEDVRSAYVALREVMTSPREMANPMPAVCLHGSPLDAHGNAPLCAKCRVEPTDLDHLLENPPPPTDALRRLLTDPAPWDVTAEPFGPGRRLNVLLSEARAAFAAMSPEEQEAHLKAQRESWVRGEMELARLERETTSMKKPNEEEGKR